MRNMSLATNNSITLNILGVTKWKTSHNSQSFFKFSNTTIVLSSEFTLSALYTKK